MASVDASTTGLKEDWRKQPRQRWERVQDLPSRRFGQLMLPTASMLAILVFTLVLRP